MHAPDAERSSAVIETASPAEPCVTDRPAARAPALWNAAYGPRIWLSVGLGLVTALAFLPVLGNGFVAWDDNENFLTNLGYRGLASENLGWAWTTFLLGVYQPLGWMILEAQYVAWGLEPWGYHLTSSLFHVANAVVLLWLTLALLGRADGAAGVLPKGRWTLPIASALAAALFAVHPLRVEPVAWLSAQTYLPCILFAMLTVLAYLRAVDAAHPRGRRGWLTLAWLLFLAALLCKATAATLPVVLLILDAYPLRRWKIDPGPPRRLGPSLLWREKIPFFALSLVFMGIAIWAKAVFESLHPIASTSLSSRFAQACHGIGFYAFATVVPLGLNAYYPLPRDLSLLQVPSLLKLGVVVGVSVAVFLLRRRWPGLLAAWTCYLVCLSPNLGFIRTGNQIAADRYSYFASLSGVPVLAYALGLLARRPGTRFLVFALALGAIAGLSVLTQRQCLTWRTSTGLWTWAYQNGGQDDIAVNNNLGLAKAAEGKVGEAREHFLRALKSEPGNASAYINLGGLVFREGNTEEAERLWRGALELSPRSDPAMTGIGLVREREGRFKEAEGWHRRALRTNPENPLAHNNLGIALARQGDEAQAAAEFRLALRINPDYPEARFNLGQMLVNLGKVAEAGPHFAEAIRLRPGYANAHAGMGAVLSRQGRFEEAAAEFETSLRLDPANASARTGLARLRGQPGR
jgi:tetratricopeptide (TPR) repeat protein